MKATTRKLFLGLPAYNEQDSIQPLFEKIVAFQQSSGLNVTVLFYDDGCVDQTKQAVAVWMDRIPIIYLDGTHNKGLGTAINEILINFLKYADSQDMLVIMDCDDTHHPQQILQMLEVVDKNPATNIVIASRYRKGALIQGLAPHRILLSLIAAMLYKIIHPMKSVRDYTCGYRLYTQAILQKAIAAYPAPLLKERGFACMVELLLKLKKVNAKAAEVPLLLQYDNKRSASKMDVSGNAFRLLKKLIDWRVRGMA